MFQEQARAGGSARLWLGVAAVALLAAAGGVVASALRSPEIRAAVEASSVPDAVRPLELLSLRHSTNAEGAFVVTGLVQNPPSGQELRGIEAVVYLFDADGKYFASGRAALDVPTVLPGDESPFVVTIAQVGNVSRYRVGFRRSDGRVVAHEDRRGELPEGTTGDILAPEPLATPSGSVRNTFGDL
jgi:hypothetical protein